MMRVAVAELAVQSVQLRKSCFPPVDFCLSKD